MYREEKHNNTTEKKEGKGKEDVHKLESNRF
jgi:hypothetical protein